MADEENKGGTATTTTDAGAAGTTPANNTAEQTAGGDELAAKIAALEKALQKANSEAAERRVKLREASGELEAERKRVTELEALAGKVTKLEEQLRKADEDRKAADLRALRVSVAAEAKLPPELAERLRGTTAEELKADAEALAKLIPAGSGQRVSPANAAGESTGTRAKQLIERIKNGNNSGTAFDVEFAKSAGGGVLGGD